MTHITSGTSFSIFLKSFGILMMKDCFQFEFNHGIPIDHINKGARLNFTFRKIMSHRPHCTLSH